MNMCCITVSPPAPDDFAAYKNKETAAKKATYALSHNAKYSISIEI